MPEFLTHTAHRDRCERIQSVRLLRRLREDRLAAGAEATAAQSGQQAAVHVPEGTTAAGVGGGRDGVAAPDGDHHRRVDRLETATYFSYTLEF